MPLTVMMELLEPRSLLSAVPTGWRGSIGLEHTVDRLHSKIGYGGITAAASGDLAFFTGRAVGGKATDKVAIYNARTRRWGQITLSLARSFQGAVGVGD